MADEDDGDPVALGQVHQAQGRLADLPDAAGRAVELGDGRGLDGVDDDQPGALRPGDLDDPLDLVLGEDPDGVSRDARQEAEARRAEPDLAGRFLARGVQHVGGAARGADQPGGRLEQQRRLADPGLAPEQDQRAGHQSPAQDAVELADPDARPRQVGVGDVGQSGRGRRIGRGSAGRPGPARGFVDDRLDQRVPATAGAALTLPAKEGLAAGLADEAALRPRHR